jgi:urease accessory protein
MSTTSTDSALLQLMWLASPALPIGGFSYSEGLEAAVERGLVHDGDSASSWLVDQLHLGLARSDLAVIAQAIDAWRNDQPARIGALNDWVLRTRETSELRQQTEQMGRSLVEWLRTVRPELVGTVRPELACPEPVEAVEGLRADLTYPLAFALAASATPAPIRDCLLCFAFGWAENMMQAAIKSVPLGQSAGQKILLRLSREIPGAVDHALALADDERQAFSPMLAILSAQHETQYSRLFRS